MSVCRQNYTSDSENIINEQIAYELRASYTYMAMASYFSRDDVALPGFAKFFSKNSDEERDHAQKLINYQNMRGGRVQYQEIEAPPTEIPSAMAALEEALNLEKTVNAHLLKVHKIAEEQNDCQLTDFIEGEFLSEQVEAMKELADLITNLKRCGGDGLGLFLFDKELEKHA
eukprot:Nk52_evm1s229 gene=Nk52_evmTU1s229